MTKVMKCNCNHTYQDTKYGAGMRVFNETRAMQGTDKVFRCTVCTSTKTR